MAEQCLASSTDIPSGKENHPLALLNVNSLSRKLNGSVALSSTSSTASSTASLTIYCIETGSVAQSLRRRQSLTNTTVVPSHIDMLPPTTATTIDEGRLRNDNDKPQDVLADVEKTVSLSDDDSELFDDDDDDDDETIIDDSLDPRSFPTPPNYVSSPCPICLEPAILQVSPCCYFLCCNSCWRAHISATINDGRIKIPCVANECSKYLTRESIVNFVRYDPPLHERYLKLYLNANQNPRAKTCPRCCHLYSLDAIKSTSTVKEGAKTKPKKLKVHSSSSSSKKIPKQVQCSECLLVWCFRCSAPWHENMTCKQFIKGDRLLMKWINQKNEEQWNARKCPKCSSLIQRAGGCPHMTCQSCACEFCYLCGRRYVQIPFIGQHSNKFSMFGCPYNFYPEKPWLRRTIRGMIATGVVVASPVIVVGAVTAAVTVLPPFGIYKLVKRVRSRRHPPIDANFPIGEPFLIEPDPDDRLAFMRAGFQLNVLRDRADDVRRLSRQRVGRLTFTQSMDEEDYGQSEDEIDEDFPLSVFAGMQVEQLFADRDDLYGSPVNFRTCPTTPACQRRNGRSLSVVHLPTNEPGNLKRHRSLAAVH